MRRMLIIVVLGSFASAVGWFSGLSQSTKLTVANIGNTEGDAKEVLHVQPAPSSSPELSLSRIFAEDHAFVDGLDKEKTVTILATGDVLLARKVNYTMVMQNNFFWPFEKTAHMLIDADLTVINLETPFIFGCQPTQTGMIFCGDPRAASGLQKAGVDIVGLSNNHMLNYGPEGAVETMHVLDNAGILPVYNLPEFIERKNVRFAFLSYTDVGKALDTDTVAEEIADAGSDSDVVIVLIHWGEEYVTQPTQRQRKVSHVMVDAGADLVIGNHPHWIQPAELYNGALIVYSHGNFIFDQEWSEETKTGIVGVYIFFDGKLKDAEFIPVRIENYGQPYILEGAKRRMVLEAMKEASSFFIDTLE